jgi:hypothetical protein
MGLISTLVNVLSKPDKKFDTIPIGETAFHIRLGQAAY